TASSVRRPRSDARALTVGPRARHPRARRRSASPREARPSGRNAIGRAAPGRYSVHAMADDFLDVRTHRFVRVAVCVPETRVADPGFNADAHLRVVERAYREGAHYALCPELGLSAYSCADLFFQETLLDGALTALRRLAEATARWNLIVSVGIPLVIDDLLFNCAVTLFGGRPVAVAPKAYPPNYREFYELRWFHP